MTLWPFTAVPVPSINREMGTNATIKPNRELHICCWFFVIFIVVSICFVCGKWKTRALIRTNSILYLFAYRFRYSLFSRHFVDLKSTERAGDHKHTHSTQLAELNWVKTRNCKSFASDVWPNTDMYTNICSMVKHQPDIAMNKACVCVCTVWMALSVFIALFQFIYLFFFPCICCCWPKVTLGFLFKHIDIFLRTV